MFNKGLVLCVLSVLFIYIPLAAAAPEPTTSLNLPIVRTITPRTGKRNEGEAVIGLGDDLDVTYSVLINIGDTRIPLVLDTGSSDLWAASDACSGNCEHPGLPLYSQQTLLSTGLDVELYYGDSLTSTYATGPIGRDTVTIAGMSTPDQSFAAINSTNTSVFQTGSAGIFGLGFPAISVIWKQQLEAQLADATSSLSKRTADVNATTTLASASIGHPPFPSFDFLKPSHNKRQTGPTAADEAIASFSVFGPLLSRLIIQNIVQAPLVATTLQRDTFELGGNAGTLSLGGLPPGVVNADLTWVPVRGYSVDQGGLPPPSDSPNETYALIWEIPVDDVYFDGSKLPRSLLAPPTISLSALVDTGNSLIRGPRDTVNHILTRIGLDSSSFTFDCSVPHNLSFEIGGVMFSVDPRDFARPTQNEDANAPLRCTAALAVTDPPGEGGFLYSWSLGVPFLKSALVAYYFGNLTYPSQDPPRVGLLSTVPADVTEQMRDAVRDAAVRSMFPSTSEGAPSGAFTATGTSVDGVPQATYSTLTVLSSGAGTLSPAEGAPILFSLVFCLIVSLTM